MGKWIPVDFGSERRGNSDPVLVEKSCGEKATDGDADTGGMASKGGAAERKFSSRGGST